MGLFDTLGIGYSGLSTAQSAMNTTSHNITNVNTQGYSRQRVEQKVNYPISTIPGDVGNGVKVEEIARIHDEFVFGRLKSSSANLEYSSFSEQKLQEIANGFADLDDLGIAQDLKDFYSGWSNFSRYPDDESAKIVVVASMHSLTTNLNDAHTRLTDLQDRLNEDFVDGID